MDVIDIEEKIVNFIRDELGGDVKDKNQDLLKSGVIDSFNMIQLIQFIEESFEVSIDMEEIDFDTFKSIQSIAVKISKWRSA